MTDLSTVLFGLSAQDLAALVGMVRQAERIEGPGASDDRVAHTLRAEAEAEPDMDALMAHLAREATDPLDFEHFPLR